MKTLVQVTGDNGSVPPGFYHRYVLLFRDDGTTQLTFYDAQDEASLPPEAAGHYSMQALKQLMERLSSATLQRAGEHLVGGETRQITDQRQVVPITYTIYADDPAGIALYEAFLALGHPQLPERLRRLFFK